MTGLRSVLLIALGVDVCFGAAPETCPVTKPPNAVFVPPAPHDALPPEGEFYFGSDDFWTWLPNDGIWGTVHDEASHGNYDRRKIAWFSKNYWWLSEAQPKLTVDANRLDAAVKPVHETWATNIFLPEKQESFMGSGIEFPTTGCWEVTANYHGHDLKFVVWVTPYTASSN